jgi:hypothetical protein
MGEGVVLLVCFYGVRALWFNESVCEREIEQKYWWWWAPRWYKTNERIKRVAGGIPSVFIRWPPPPPCPVQEGRSSMTGGSNATAITLQPPPANPNQTLYSHCLLQYPFSIYSLLLMHNVWILYFVEIEARISVQLLLLIHWHHCGRRCFFHEWDFYGFTNVTRWMKGWLNVKGKYYPCVNIVPSGMKNITLKFVL